MHSCSFHCLFCFGYEDRGAKSTGVLIVPPISPMTGIHMVIAANAAQLSDEVTLYTHGDDDIAAQLSPLAKAPFKIDTRKIKRLVDNGRSSVTIQFTDGSVKEEAFLVHNTKTTVQGPFIEQLGLDVNPTGDILAPPPFHQTSVRGVCGRRLYHSLQGYSSCHRQRLQLGCGINCAVAG
ncbi:hypothetical protein OCU04_003261 [Sclerotinia nivalis]|uniref:Uncharacterized protein n=1 Tax=Sclerotinia nivalis TaxID=352851 RepID=A0A9X0DP37_9HELO|nr:hypothetical protein OCU04_003261 [Sclerotinia nivalis]